MTGAIHPASLAPARFTPSGARIPPAWTDVWISPDPRGHLQATGRDARGRKQHRYHPAFRARRERAKFDRMIAFARALPRIRERVDADLAMPGLPREKVLAAVVRLLELYRKEKQEGEAALAFFRRVDAQVIKTALADLTDFDPASARPDEYLDHGDEQPFVVAIGQGECAA